MSQDMWCSCYTCPSAGIVKACLNTLNLGDAEGSLDRDQQGRAIEEIGGMIEVVYCSPFVKLGLSWNHEQSQLAFMNICI